MNGPSVDFAKVENVLILRTDHLGDLLLSTPLIRKLRTALPGRRFTLVASPDNAEGLAGWDAIDEIRIYDADWPLSEKGRFIRELRQTRWDLCLTLAPRTRSYLLGRLSGAPVRAGLFYPRRILVRLLLPLWLTHAYGSRVDECVEAGRPVTHEVLQLAEIEKILGLPQSEPGPLEIPLLETPLEWAKEWLAGNGVTPGAAKGPAGSCLIGIHGAGKWVRNGWTAADFMTLVRQTAASRAGGKVLLTFGPGDTVLQSAVESALREMPDPAVLLPGRLPVARWAALFSLCDAIISPDTGSLHLAVAVKVPVVALYESSNFMHCSTQWAPWKAPHATVRRDVPAVTVPLILEETRRMLEWGGNR